MDYGQPKVLPVAGAGGLFAASLTNQLIVIAAVALGVLLVGLLIRVLWRRNRKIGQ